MEINPTGIPGRWRNGFALDVQTKSSVFLGHDEYGHPQFDNTRSEIGELLYKLKYRGEKSVISKIAESAATFIQSNLPKLDLIIPAPPSGPGLNSR
jgi:predicted amidophosphoribosyltransferase